jgi:hypothetical protein
LKALEFQLIVDDFKVCTLAQPQLTDCDGCILKIWSGLRRSDAGTTGSRGRGLDLWRLVRDWEWRGRGEMIDVRAGISNGGEEETGIGE